MIQKFRAWDKKENKWVDYPIYIDANGDVYWEHYERGLQEEGDLIVMQYTGLKDKHGVQIFEGDIIKCTSKIYDNFGANETGEYEETIKQVIWKEDSWGTRVINSNLTSKGAEKRGLVISAKYAEVIGNIYENSDLI